MAGLDVLIKDLVHDGFKYLSQKFNGELLGLIKHKVIYPYKQMINFERFSRDRLPDKCKFHSSLKGECVSDKDYLHAVNVCHMFEMRTMGDNHDLYLKKNVLLCL